jgi:hypothetical protein
VDNLLLMNAPKLAQAMQGHFRSEQYDEDGTGRQYFQVFQY